LLLVFCDFPNLTLTIWFETAFTHRFRMNQHDSTWNLILSDGNLPTADGGKAKKLFKKEMIIAFQGFIL